MARWRAETAGGNRKVTSADAEDAYDAPYFAMRLSRDHGAARGLDLLAWT